MTKAAPRIFKFMSVDGTVFHLRCGGVFDAFLDRSLLGFLTLCITIFTAKNLMMSAILVPREDVLHWTSQVFGIVAILVYVLAFIAIVLTVLGLILSRLIKWGWMTTIYVPLFYVCPLAVYGLRAVLEGRDVMTPNTVTIVVMFLIICACFDILYGRFVAPFHSKYIGVDDLETVSHDPKGKAVQSIEVDEAPIPTGVTPDPKSHVPHPGKLAVVKPTTSELSSGDKAKYSNLDLPEARARITIGKQSFFQDEIRWIQSEDHYLYVQLVSDSVLLLGKLSEAVAQLPEDQGLQINRSTWVAHSEIQRVDALNSRKMFATLTDGRQLKVTTMGRKLLEKSNTAIAGQ